MPNPNPQNQESIREEQVQNGVNFLSHPRVKGSPVTYRRSFLERKGLTKKEIDEAFRRVPDETPTLSTTRAAVANQGGQSQPISNIQGQVQTKYQQPLSASRGSKLGTLTSRFHWSHALLAIGVFAISGAGTAVLIKNAVVPRFKSWIHKVAHEDGEEDLEKKINDAKPRLVEEAAASAAKTVASYVAHASHEMVSKTEEKRYFGELKSLLGIQVQETKSMSNSIKKLEENKHFEELKSLLSMQVEEMKSMSSSIKKLEERSLLPRPYPKTYMEVVAMAQRGEIALQGPQPKPWEVPPVQRPAWVPPEPPHLAMPEAAAAIMRPKKRPFVEEQRGWLEEQQQWPDEQFIADDVADKFQGMTNLSESAGVSDIDGESQLVTTNTSEMQGEENRWYYEP